MKCNNSSIIKQIPTLYFLIIAGLVATVILGLQISSIDPGQSFNLYLGVTGFLILLFLYFYFNAKFFEFDSTGEVLIFVNQGTFLTRFIQYRGKKVEFPKQKLRCYDVQDYFFYKSLTIYVSSNDRRTKKITFNTTFLNNKKHQLILESLSEVATKNKGTSQWT